MVSPPPGKMNTDRMVTGMSGPGHRFRLCNRERRSPLSIMMTSEPSSPATEDPVTTTQRGRPLVLVAAAALAVVVMALIVLDRGSAGPDGSQPDRLDQFAFSTVDGDSVTLVAYASQPLVLNYFAAWCGPCRAELPDFEAAHQEVKDDGVVFLGINRDPDQASWKSFIEQTGVTYETVYEGAGRGSFDFVGALGMPTTVFVTADGEIAEVFSGPLNRSSLDQKMQEHFFNG
jgi:peroxiredoxin